MPAPDVEFVIPAWIFMMATAFLIALAASLPPRRPLRRWTGDLLVKWGLAGILMWIVVTFMWAIREVLSGYAFIKIYPIEGYIEYASLFAVALTAIATLAFFAVALLINALFE
jgi:hypothetical protein